MSSHAIIFSDDGSQQVVCPAADVRMAETPKDANDIIQAYRNERAEGTVFHCLDCFKAHGVKIPVTPKLGDIVSPHFSHEPGHDKKAHESAARSNVGITEHHIMGVAEVVAHLRAQGISELDIAENVVSKSEDVNLRPDIIAKLPDGTTAAYEVQFSSIPIDRLKERTLGMLRFGYSHVYWFLYPNAYKNENRFFLNSTPDVSFYWMQAEKNTEGENHPVIIKIAPGTLPEEKSKVRKAESLCRHAMTEAELEMTAAVASATPPRPIDKAAILDSLPSRVPPPSPFSPAQRSAIESTPIPDVPNPKGPIVAWLKKWGWESGATSLKKGAAVRGAPGRASEKWTGVVVGNQPFADGRNYWQVRWMEREANSGPQSRNPVIGNTADQIVLCDPDPIDELGAA